MKVIDEVEVDDSGGETSLTVPDTRTVKGVRAGSMVRAHGVDYHVLRRRGATIYAKPVNEDKDDKDKPDIKKTREDNQDGTQKPVDEKDVNPSSRIDDEKADKEKENDPDDKTESVESDDNDLVDMTEDTDQSHDSGNAHEAKSDDSGHAEEAVGPDTTDDVDGRNDEQEKPETDLESSEVDDEEPRHESNPRVDQSGVIDVDPVPVSDLPSSKDIVVSTPTTTDDGKPRHMADGKVKVVAHAVLNGIVIVFKALGRFLKWIWRGLKAGGRELGHWYHRIRYGYSPRDLEHAGDYELRMMIAMLEDCAYNAVDPPRGYDDTERWLLKRDSDWYDTKMSDHGLVTLRRGSSSDETVSEYGPAAVAWAEDLAGASGVLADYADESSPRHEAAVDRFEDVWSWIGRNIKDIRL